MKEQILKLRAEGKTYNEIAKLLSCSKGSISYYCGDGQKEKALLRVAKSRKRGNTVTRRKIESFLRTNIREFKRDRATLLNNSNLSYKEAFEKILSNPYCYLTGRKIDLEDNKSYQLDHIVPSSRGGSNEIHNLGLACKDANQSKTNLTIEEYIALCKEVLEFNGYEIIKK